MKLSWCGNTFIIDWREDIRWKYLEISNQVLSMFLEGKSEEEIMKLSRLSEDQVHNILSELDFSENRNTVSYLL